MTDDRYAGDVSAAQAWKMLEGEPGSALIDVRTDAEWSYVGLPDLSRLGKEVVRLAWQTFPDMAPNPRFASQIEALGLAPDAALLFLCRSGQRSRAAAMAMTARGFKRCYNVADGFEGPHDEHRHRGAVAGWKASGLPWRQG